MSDHTPEAQANALRAEIERLRAVLKVIASCTSHAAGDIVDLARRALEQSASEAKK